MTGSFELSCTLLFLLMSPAAFGSAAEATAPHVLHWFVSDNSSVHDLVFPGWHCWFWCKTQWCSAEVSSPVYQNNFNTQQVPGHHISAVLKSQYDLILNIWQCSISIALLAWPWDIPFFQSFVQLRHLYINSHLRCTVEFINIWNKCKNNVSLHGKQCTFWKWTKTFIKNVKEEKYIKFYVLNNITYYSLHFFNFLLIFQKRISDWTERAFRSLYLDNSSFYILLQSMYQYNISAQKILQKLCCIEFFTCHRKRHSLL